MPVIAALSLNISRALDPYLVLRTKTSLFTGYLHLMPGPHCDLCQREKYISNHWYNKSERVENIHSENRVLFQCFSRVARIWKSLYILDLPGPDLRPLLSLCRQGDRRVCKASHTAMVADSGVNYCTLCSPGKPTNRYP